MPDCWAGQDPAILRPLCLSSLLGITSHSVTSRAVLVAPTVGLRTGKLLATDTEAGSEPGVQGCVQGCVHAASDTATKAGAVVHVLKYWIGVTEVRCSAEAAKS